VTKPTIRRRSGRPILTTLATALIAVSTTVWVTAQAASQAESSLAQTVSSAIPGEAAPLRYNNRTITVLHATVLSRSPAERAAAAAHLLDSLTDAELQGRVGTRPFHGATMISVGNRDVFAILPLDVNPLTGETQETKAADAAVRLRQAIDEAVELRTPHRMLRATALALGATLLVAGLFWGMARLHRVLSVRLTSSTERRLERLTSGDTQLVRLSHASDLLNYAITALSVVVALFLTYSWLTFVLRRFPYTRPWGESLRSFLLDRVSTLALKLVSTFPDLFTVLVIALAIRFTVRLVRAIFEAVEAERITIPYVFPETAQTTRRLVSTLLWLLGLVAAYPYLPGSQTDAFKGVSVFVGLVISLGSSGIVNQMMSGLTMTYSRAVRLGDFVRMGDVEGTVTQLGALSTKVKTPRGEEVTIPNALVMSDVTTNYSRLAATEGVYVPTTVSIGYDTPWRQVQALLLLAAGRTPGVREQPKPVVRQSALEDFAVLYTLMVCLERPQQRGPVLDALHANIQDAFNEYGVQIMSPNYEADPEGRKVVPPERWYAAPAGPPAATEQIAGH
jgi:small-conductance mechanosensitive channel